MATQYMAGQLLVGVKPDASGASKMVRREFDSMPDPVVKLDADIRSVERAKGKAQAELDSIKARPAKLDLDIREVEGKAAQARARLEDLRAKPVTAKVEADIQVAEARLARLDSQLGRLRSERVSPKLEADTASAEARVAGLGARLDQLTAQRRDIKAGVDDGEVGTGLARVQGRVAGAVGQIGGTVRQKLGGALGGSVGGDLGAGIADGFSGKAAMFAAAGTAIGAVLVGSLSQAMNVEQARAKLAVQLGASAEESRAYGAIAGRLYSSAYGQNLEQVNDAIRGVVQNIGAMDDPSLERVSGKVLSLSEAFGVDLQGSTAAVATMMRSGLAPDADAALDVITAGFQTGADKAGDFLDTLTEYSVQFQKLGLDGAAATGLINQGLNAGARSSDLVADALKEFSIRAVDGSKLTAEGFQSVGLNAQDMAAKIARGGPEASQALDLTLDRLRAMPDPVKRSQAAVALFGTQAEDLGASLLALDPSAAVQSMSNVGGTADRMTQTLGETASSRVESFKRTMQMGVVDFLGGTVLPIFDTVAGALATVFGPAWQPILDILGFIAGYGAIVAGALGIIALGTWAWTSASAALAGTWMANPITWIVIAIIGLVGVVIYAYNHFEWFRNAVSAVWNAISTATMWLWTNVFQPVFSFIGGIVMWLWTNVISPVVSWITSQWSWLSIVIGILVGPIGWVILAFTTFRDVTMAVLGAIGGVLMWLWLTVFVPAWNAIAMVVSWAWTNIISPVLTFLWDALRFLGAIIFVVLVAPFLIAWNLISAAVSFAWNAVILPVWNALVAFAQNIIMPMLMFLWQNVVLPVWNAIGAIISFAWNSVILPVWNALVAFLNVIIIPLLRFLYDNVVKPVFDLIGAVIAFVWNSIILPTWNALVAFVNGVLVPLMRFLYEQVIKPVWDAIGAAIQFVWQSVIKPAWDAVAAGLMWLSDRFRDGVNLIGQIWNGIRSMLAKPINFMIDVVWNRGIVPAWNKVAGLVGLGPIAPLGLIPEFATGGSPADATGGGRMRGPGTGTSDSILARVSNNEFVVRESVARRTMPFLRALNAGEGEAIQAAGGGAAARNVKTFSGRSGLGLDPMAGVPRVPGFATGGMIDERIRAAKAWLSGPARGAPYVYGGGTNPRAGMDCSSMQSAVTHILSGRPPDSGRIGATGSMPWGGFLPGLNGQYAIGNKPNDHMAGTLAGQNVEQHGPNGNPFTFPSRWGADNGYFPQKFHLGEVGGAFVSGGNGGGGGFFDFISPMIRAAFDALTNPAIDLVRNVVGAPPPEWRAVPPAFATKARDTVREFMLSKVAAFLGQGTGGPAINDVSGLNGRQRQAAGTIIGVAKSRGMPRKAAEIGVATGMQESQLGTIGYGRAVDHDSLGLFQQRPSQGWGTPAQIQNDVYASNKFFDGLARINYMAMSHTAAAQAVQRSAFGDAYQKWVPLAISAVNAFPGGYDAGGLGVGRGWMWKGTPRDERVLDPQETRDYETLGPLVREMEAARLPVQGAAPLSPAQIDAMTGGTASRFPDSFRLTSGRLEIGRDGLVEIVDGRIDAVTDALTDGRRTT